MSASAFSAAPSRARSSASVGLLALARVEPVEFGEAQGQLLGLGGGARAASSASAASAALARQARQRSRRRRRQLGRQAAEGVEQRAVGAGVEQADGLVLAVHLQQQRAELAQHADAGRPGR